MYRYIYAGKAGVEFPFHVLIFRLQHEMNSPIISIKFINHQQGSAATVEKAKSLFQLLATIILLQIVDVTITKMYL